MHNANRMSNKVVLMSGQVSRCPSSLSCFFVLFSIQIHLILPSTVVWLCFYCIGGLTV